MIGVDRSLVAEPAILGKPFSDGKTELDRVVTALAKHRTDNLPDKEFSFSFSRHKAEEVKRALTTIFHGKCAYCETFYSSSQPMDVEHWRPKGEVHLEDGTMHEPGYYWLAATWDNLLPSCIDCNRSREQDHLMADGKVEKFKIGKANQFPLADDNLRAHAHDPVPDLAGEGARLINPCMEDPERFFEYSPEGAILPRAGLDGDRPRAEASILVYALNRSGLVAERQEVIRRIDHRLSLVRRLKDLQDRLDAKKEAELASIVEELISIELDALLAMKRSSAPFAGLARFILGEAEQSGDLPPRSQRPGT